MSVSLQPHECSTSGFPVLHYLPEFAQVHVHWVCDATQPSHLLPPLSPFAFSLSHPQGLFQWVVCFQQVTKVLEFQFQISSSVNFQGWCPLELTGLISLQAKGLSRILSSTTIQKHQFFGTQISLWSNPHMDHVHDNWKDHSLTIWTSVGNVMSLLFNALSRFVITCLLRSKCLPILWLQSPSALILEPSKGKSVPASTFSPSICHEVIGLDAAIFIFWMLSFKPAFSLSSFIFIKRLSSSSSLSAIEWYHLHIWGCWYFSGNLDSACNSSSLAFCLVYSAYQLNNQDDNMQLLPIFNQSLFPWKCPAP